MGPGVTFLNELHLSEETCPKVRLDVEAHSWHHRHRCPLKEPVWILPMILTIRQKTRLAAGFTHAKQRVHYPERVVPPNRLGIPVFPVKGVCENIQQNRMINSHSPSLIDSAKI